MSTLQMPKVDSSILSSRDKIISDIEKIIDPKNVLSHQDEIRPYETDALSAYKQTPLLVVLPETVDEDFAQAASRITPSANIGGMGPVVLPGQGKPGSGDVPSPALDVADIDDDEEEAKKDKTKKKL